MNNQARPFLQQCIRDYGTTLGREPLRLEALLKDYAKGQFKREIFVIVQAAKENVVEQLLHNTAPLELIAGTLAHQLTENYGTDRHLADWAIESWLFALDLSCPTNKVEPAKQATPTVAAKPKPDPKPVASIKPAKSTAKNSALIDGRYLDNGNGTVTDQQTGLQWMRGCLGQSWDGTKTYNWDEANQVAKNISFAGYSDWRLPTIDELESIVEKHNSPAINHEAFPNTSASAVWSSSPSPNGSNGVWCVNFYGGYVTGNYKYGDLHVRLVRSINPAKNSPSINPAKSTANTSALIDEPYLDNGDGTVTDLIKNFLDLPIPPRRNLFGKLFIAECYLLQNESLVMVEPYGMGIIIDKDELSAAILNKRISANIISDRNLMVI